MMVPVAGVVHSLRAVSGSTPGLVPLKSEATVAGVVVRAAVWAVVDPH